MMEYLNELNEAQREAVIHVEGPSMVIAGAGSGKTRVLTFRIAHLINKNVDPFNILALTFTNKAAREMKERIASIVGEQDAKNIWMGTFHSVFARILRTEHEKIGYPRDFTIYDTADAKNLIKDIIREMMLDDKIYKPALVYNRISTAKNNLISARAYAENTDVVADDRMSGKPKIAEIYARYEIRCFKASAMDFDDLLFKTNVLLRDFPDVLQKYQEKFKYILVDEYQDTNYAQYLIVKKLAARFENVCVVGDDAQSIYSFRGANIQNILNFKKDYPDFKIFKLEQNYRSTKTIVNAANSIIQKNKDQIQKEVWTDNDEGDKIKVMQTASDNEEGRVVAQKIFDIKFNQQARPKDFAILYRTNAQSRSFEEALRKMNIPYRIYGGLSFYQRKEIKDLLAYFRLTANHNDEEALKRIINYPKRGIGDATVQALIVAADEGKVGIWNVIEMPEMYNVKLGSGPMAKVQEFANMIKSFRAEMKTIPAFELANRIATSSGILKELYDDKSPEGVSRYENIQELLNGIKEFSDTAVVDEEKSLSDFLIDVALLTDADQNDEENDKVILMTIHSAKGLEFPYVFIVGLEENLFPSQLSINTRADLEEERRLFYVALTRAEKKAFLTYAASRYRWGNLTYSQPSRFIEEIAPEWLDKPEVKEQDKFEWDEPWEEEHGYQKMKKKPFGNNAANTNKKPIVPSTPSTAAVKKNFKKVNNTMAAATGNDSNSSLNVGDNVMHASFGKGKIISIDGSFPNTKATIFFPEAGQKQLLLRFAKLEVVD
jgi:DNA helicase-2/ATP-dependent DNA helicase PcrA